MTVPLDPRRVRDLYDRAAALPEAEARGLLHDVAREDPALAEEVASLLAMRVEVGSFLDAPTAPMDARRDGGAVPALLGPYRLVAPLGHGGHGSVFRAVHEASGREVAVKTVRVATPGLLDAIRREIHALARMDHPGVVRILDHGLHDGAPWYAMELLEGTTLAGRLAADDGAASTLGAGSGATLGETDHRGAALGDALGLAHRLCDPLGYVHDQGVVHRDLKPSNVLFRPDGAPVIVDFGVASPFVTGLSREVIRPEGGMVGTVLYMAPEQIRGELPDARADIYALGCILYELLTGRPPFTGSEAGTVLRGHLEAAPVPPSALVRGVPPEVDELVRRLLAKDPRDRIGYALDVARALERCGVAPAVAPRAAPCYLYRPRQAGREEVLADLGAAIDALPGSGGGLVLVAGESGIGKTRLLLELGRQALTSGIQVLMGECAEPQASGDAPAGPPLGLFLGPLQAVADRCHDEAAAGRLLADRGPLLGLYEPSIAALPGMAGRPLPASLPPPEARRRLYRRMTETLSSLAREAPVLLLLDDLQWADDLSLGLLRHLARFGVPAGRLLTVATYRSDDAAPAVRELALIPGVRGVTLPRLDRTAVASMVGDMLALPSADAALVDFLTAACEGNPFFVAEYLRAAVGERLLWRDDEGAWRVGIPEAGGADREPVGLPSTLRELIGRRLAAVTGVARRLLHASAVVGSDAERPLLSALAGASESDAFPALDDLLSRQLLTEGSDGRLRVAHGRIRAVAYAAIAPERRAIMHAAAAAALSARPAADQHQAEIGSHWERAGDLPRAASCYLAAARHANARYALPEAEALYRRFFAIEEPGTARAVTARVDLAQNVLRLMGRRAEALAEMDRAREAAQAGGHRAQEAAAWRVTGALQRVLGRQAEAEAALVRARELARAAGDDAGERLAAEQLAVLCQGLGEMERARGLYEEALARHRAAGDRRNAASALQNLATLHHQQRRLDRARELYEEALSIFEQLGDRRLQGDVLGNLATLELDRGRFAEAARLYGSALVASRSAGDRAGEMLVLGNLGICLGQSGDGIRAREHHEAALAIAIEVEDPGCEALNRICLATLALAEGGWEEALAATDRLLHDGRLEGDRHLTATAWMLRAEALLVGPGRLEDSRRALRSAREILEELGDRLDLAKCLCQEGHLELAQGREATQQLAAARAIAAELHVEPGSELGRLAAKLGRAVEAAAAGRRLARGEGPSDLPRGKGNSAM